MLKYLKSKEQKKIYEKYMNNFKPPKMPDQLVIIASCINFLLISNGDPVLRYDTDHILKQKTVRKIYINYLRRKLNNKNTNNIIFNSNYLGGYYIKQKLKIQFSK